MGRFSIRMQVMLLATAFIAMLLALSAISWSVKTDLTQKMHHTTDVFKQSEVLAEITKHIQHVELLIVLFVEGDDSKVAEMRANLDEAVEHFQEVPLLFGQTKVETSQRDATAEQLSQASQKLDALETDIEALTALPLAERQAFAYRSILPGFETIRSELFAMTEELAGDVNRLEVEVTAVIDGSRFKQMAGIGSVVTLAVFLSFVFGRSLSLPIQRARDAVVRLARRDYDFTLSDMKRSDEVGMISRTLDELRGGLMAADESEKRAKEEGRPDDTVEAFKNRLETYNSQTAPLIPYYEGRGKLADLDGMGDVDEVAGRIDSAVDG
jgi:adenylate kinase family enzyme